MSKEELESMRLELWLKVLESVEVEYKGRTIGNIIDNIKQRIEHHESNQTLIY